jgi:ribosomal protein S21
MPYVQHPRSLWAVLLKQLSNRLDDNQSDRPRCHTVTGSASTVTSMLPMVQVRRRDGEDFDDFLFRFEKTLDRETGRPWNKRRYGYYESPSLLRRKKRKLRHIRLAISGNVWLRLDLAAQWQRTGPTNAAGY